MQVLPVLDTCSDGEQYCFSLEDTSGDSMSDELDFHDTSELQDSEQHSDEMAYVSKNLDHHTTRINSQTYPERTNHSSKREDRPHKLQGRLLFSVRGVEELEAWMMACINLCQGAFRQSENFYLPVAPTLHTDTRVYGYIQPSHILPRPSTADNTSKESTMIGQSILSDLNTVSLSSNDTAIDDASTADENKIIPIDPRASLIHNPSFTELSGTFEKQGNYPRIPCRWHQYHIMIMKSHKR